MLSAPLTTGVFYLPLTYSNEFIDPTENFQRPWIDGFLAVLDLYKAAGAAGVVLVLDASQANTVGQYINFHAEANDIPTLIVNRDTGRKLKYLARRRPKATLRLQATVTPQVQTDSLVAILPGATEENIILNTHSDGQNFAEENGVAACLAIARHYAMIPQNQRPRTLVFSLITGHMMGGMPETQGFVVNNPDLISKATAAFTLEHFGCQGWKDGWFGYRSTGKAELGALYHSMTKIVRPAVDAMKATKISRCALIRTRSLFFGIGQPLEDAGIPSLAFIAGPTYLVQIAENDCLDKFDATRMGEELNLVMELLQRIEVMSREELRTPIFG